MFETDRLILRAFRESDWDSMLQLWNNPITQRFLWNDYIVPRGERFIKEILKPGVESSQLYVVITSKDKRGTDGQGEYMGYCAMSIANPKNREAHLEIGLLPEWQSKGYGTETLKFLINHAFRELGIHRVTLGVLEGNAAARAVYTKIGFKEEGRRRKVNWVDGGWEDAFFMGILEDEWAELYWQKTQ